VGGHNGEEKGGETRYRQIKIEAAGHTGISGKQASQTRPYGHQEDRGTIGTPIVVIGK
jgi:hypothetical protein